MRLLPSLAAVALLTMTIPAMAAGDTPAAGATDAAPTMESTAPAAPRAANPEGVTDEADQNLWCGHAFSNVSEQIKAGGDTAGATEMLNRGNVLIERGAALLTAAGFDEARVASTKTGYVDQVGTELAGDGSTARYTYEECVGLPQ